MTEYTDNLKLKGKDWIPFGIGIPFHLYRFSKDKMPKSERLNPKETLKLVGYTAYQVGSIVAVPLVLAHPGFLEKLVN